MPVNSDAVGTNLEAVEHVATTRDILAFAAAFNGLSSSFLDDADEDRFQALPMYVVGLEWKIVQRLREVGEAGLTPEEQLKGVHAIQDTRFYQPIYPGDRLVGQGHLAGIRKSRAGAIMDTEVAVTNAETGQTVSRTIYTSVFRGVAVNGPDRPLEDVEFPRDEPVDQWESDTLPLSRGFPHVYSECANIWNPIHTERKVALKSGLPDIIVHGTALWTLAGIAVTNARANGEYGRIKRLYGRFTAMVIPGTKVAVRHGVGTESKTRLHFELLNADGKKALSNGFVELA